MSEQARRYRAFISYSQKDKAHARRIQQSLENFRLPRGIDPDGVDIKTRRLGRFFRDDDEMGAATDLGAALRGAIADAENLIVVCSPNAAKSRWVNEEIIHFKRTGRADQIFAVIVAGEPTPAPERKEQECFPPALQFELDPDGGVSDRAAEPLGLDVRKERFGRLIVRLAAGLVRTPFDALWKREQRRRRTGAIVASLAASLLLTIIGVAATQSLWRPKLDAYLRFERFAHSAANLAVAPPGTTFQDCGGGTTDCPLMVVIPSGRFQMGTAPDDRENVNHGGDESPLRQISIQRFAVSRHEVTFGNWRACVAAGGCNGYQPDRSGQAQRQGDGDWASDDRPVVDVSWDDAQTYLTWLSRVTGQRYRLLSEAEWEYAARAQTTPDAPHTRFSWGDDDAVCQPDAPNGAAFSALRIQLSGPDGLFPMARVGGGCEQRGAWPGGSFPNARNRFGLDDMHGNVSEWVGDCYAPYDARASAGDTVESDGGAVAPPNGYYDYEAFRRQMRASDPCITRVIRGGSWSDEVPTSLRSASRGRLDRRDVLGSLGFRIAREL
jgi:formylglycine-generating enzyme required for sulfatase activity